MAAPSECPNAIWFVFWDVFTSPEHSFVLGVICCYFLIQWKHPQIIIMTKTASDAQKCGRPVVSDVGIELPHQKDYRASKFNIDDAAEAEIIPISTYWSHEMLNAGQPRKHPNQTWKLNAFLALTIYLRTQFDYLKDEEVKKRMGKLQQKLSRIACRFLNTPPPL